ncbi:MAG: transporter substrate-binding domain-containing protein [Lachnospiraceae bacterium]|nr:transporter substrate-binding domain-containing protein [Lachnospiraceae bacterium]
MKKIMKRVLAAALASVMAIGCLTGCGAAEEAGAAAGGGKLDKILADGKIVIGVNPPGEPICFYDDQGNLIGYDIDWANKLGETLGVEVEFVEVNGENRISAVTSGRVDVIFANITGNLERAKTINFSMPYLRTGIKMATRADLEGVDVVADLNSPDYTVAVASGSTGEQLVLEMAPNCNISYVASFADQCLALQEGKADAIFEDGTSIDYMAGQNDYMTAESMVYTSDPICVGYAKGDADFARYIDMFVSYMITSGWQKETYYKWFGSEYTGTLSTIW